MKIEWSDSTLKITWCGTYYALKYAYKKLVPYIKQLLQCLRSLTKNLNQELLKSYTQ